MPSTNQEMLEAYRSPGERHGPHFPSQPSEGTQLANDFRPLELWSNQFLLFGRPRLFVILGYSGPGEPEQVQCSGEPCRMSLSSEVGVLGGAHRRKPPPWPGTGVAVCVSYFKTRGPARGRELTSQYQPWEFRKGRKEAPCVQPPPRMLLAGLHLGWATRWPPGRTLSRDEGSEITRKRIPSAPGLRAPWGGNSPGSSCLALLLSARPPSPVEPLALSACASPWTIRFWVLDRSSLSGPGRGSVSRTWQCWLRNATLWEEGALRGQFWTTLAQVTPGSNSVNTAVAYPFF